MIAITNTPSPQMGDCALTYVQRAVIDDEKLKRQHQQYNEQLSQLGVQTRCLKINAQHPDCCFVEDLAIILDEVAILTPMGSPSRQEEPAGIRDILAEYRSVKTIDPPAKLEGGDVVVLGKELLVGISSRTDRPGIESLAEIVKPYGYSVKGVPVDGCLHLKTGCCALPDGRLLMNPEWVQAASLDRYHALEIDPSEPFAADILVVDSTVCLDQSNRRTAQKLERLGYRTLGFELTEFAKAEGGITCLSLLVK